jgi:hypothetical protein
MSRSKNLLLNFYSNNLVSNSIISKKQFVRSSGAQHHDSSKRLNILRNIATFFTFYLLSSAPKMYKIFFSCICVNLKMRNIKNLDLLLVVVDKNHHRLMKTWKRTHQRLVKAGQKVKRVRGTSRNVFRSRLHRKTISE